MSQPRATQTRSSGNQSARNSGVYGDVCIDLGYRIDMLVNGTVVVEVKAIAKLAPIHNAQLLSYLKLGGYKVGLLINFNVPHLRDGIKRIVNQL